MGGAGVQVAQRRRPVLRAVLGALLAAAALLWLAVIADVVTINDGDAAGNGLSYAYGVLLALALWAVLAILTGLAVLTGDLPRWVRWSALVTVPASGAAVVAAIELVRGPSGVAWPLIVPLAAPPLLAGVALSAQRSGWPARNDALVWMTAGVLLLAALPWPATIARERAAAERRGRIEAEYSAERELQAAARQNADRERFARLDANSPLWEWWDFTLAGNPLRDEALAAIRTLPHRQIQAQTMLEGGFALPMTILPELAIEATPEFCVVAKRFLRLHADSLRPAAREAPSYTLVSPRLEQYLPGMTWLAAQNCDLGDELTAFALTARSYRDSPEQQSFLAALDTLRRR